MAGMTRRESIAALAAMVIAAAPLRAQQHQEARDSWQRVDEVFRELWLAPGSRVADLGAGGGYFTTRLARAVGPAGRVYAVDVNPISLRELRDKLPKDLANIEIVRGEENDPKLPPGELDAVLVVNAYHEFAEYPAVLARVRDALRPGGRLVLVEPAPVRPQDTTRAAQTAVHTIAIEFVETELAQAGFEIIRKDPVFVKRPPHQTTAGETFNHVDWLLTSRRPGGSQLF